MINYKERKKNKKKMKNARVKTNVQTHKANH